MADQTLFHATFAGPAGSAGSYLPEVGQIEYVAGALNGAGQLVATGGTIELETAYTSPADPAGTYKASLNVTSIASEVSLAIYGGYEPVADVSGGGLAALVSSDTLEYTVRQINDEFGNTYSVPLPSTGLTSAVIEILVGPMGATISVAGQVVVSVPEFTPATFGLAAIGAYTYAYGAAAFDELVITESIGSPDPDPEPEPEPGPGPAAGLPAGLDTSWEAEQEVAGAPGEQSAGWSVSEDFAPGYFAPAGATVATQEGTSGATWSATKQEWFY